MAKGKIKKPEVREPDLGTPEKNEPEENENIFDGVDFCPPDQQVIKCYRVFGGKSFLVCEKTPPFSDTMLQSEYGGGEYKVYLKVDGKIVSWRTVYIEGPPKKIQEPVQLQDHSVSSDTNALLIALLDKLGNQPKQDDMLGSLKTFQATFMELTTMQLDALKSQAEIMKTVKENASPTGMNDVIQEGIQAAVSLIEQYMYFKNPELLRLKNAMTVSNQAAAPGEPAVTPGAEENIVITLGHAMDLIGDAMKNKKPIEVVYADLKNKFPAVSVVMQTVPVNQVLSMCGSLEGFDSDYIIKLYERVRKGG